MGIEVSYRRLPESKLAKLERNPQKALEYLMLPPGMDMQTWLQMLNDPDAEPRLSAAYKSAREDPKRVDLHKAWHALHFLLTGDPSDDTEHRPGQPLHNVVMGGRPTSIEMDYGPLRKFLHDDIAEIIEALSQMTADQLQGRFSAEAFNVHKISPTMPTVPGSLRRERNCDYLFALK